MHFALLSGSTVSLSCTVTSFVWANKLIDWLIDCLKRIILHLLMNFVYSATCLYQAHWLLPEQIVLFWNSSTLITRCVRFSLVVNFNSLYMLTRPVICKSLSTCYIICYIIALIGQLCLFPFLFSCYYSHYYVLYQNWWIKVVYINKTN